MPELTPIQLDTLKFQLENGLPLDRELVAVCIRPYYENEAMLQNPILVVPEIK